MTQRQRQRRQQGPPPGVNWARVLEITVIGIITGIGYIIVKTILIVIEGIARELFK